MRKTKAFRIVYAWEWGAGAGHLSRFEAVARELVRDGHQVVLVVKDLTLARKIFPFQVWGATVEVRQAPTLVEPLSTVQSQPTTFAELAWNLGYGDTERTLASIEAWRGLLRDSRCDGLIADFGLGAVVAAQSLGIPAIRIGTGFECPPPNMPFAHLRLPYNGNRDAAIYANLQVRQNVDTAVATLLRTEVDKPYEASIDRVPQLVATVPELDHYTTPRADSQYVGVWAINQCGTDIPKFQGNRACFAYLRNSKHVVPVLSFLAKLRFEVVLTGPAATIEISDSDVNRRIHRCQSMIDINQLKGRISFGITNANHGTTIQLLSLGIPVIAIPLFVEQVVTAYNLVSQRLGVLVSNTSSVELEDAISRIGTFELLERCQEFATLHIPRLSSSLMTVMARLSIWINTFH